MAPRRRQSYKKNLKRLSKEKNTRASSKCAGWQSALPSPIDKLSALYRFGKLTDLTITFPGHKDILKVHRLVLAMSSPVFECMLFGPMAEGEELKLPEDPPQAFKWLIKYVYCGTTNLPRVSTALQVYHLASKYQMKALSTLCSEYLEKNLNGNNFPLIFDTASLLADKALQKSCAEVHRLVLAMSSPVLECMLFGPMTEGGELKIHADPPQAFKWLIKYVYCGTTNLSRVSTAVQVHHLASKYQMKALSTLCSEYLEANLNGNNFPLIFDTASLHADKALLKACAEVVRSSAESVLSSPDIGELSRQSLKHFLQQDMRVKSELLVFNGIVKWGKMHGSHPMESCEGRRSLREEIEEFLPYIRFLTLTLEEFIEHAVPARILTDAESTSILDNLFTKVEKVPLPTFCSVIKEKRRLFLRENLLNICLFEVSYYHYYGLSGPIRHELLSDMSVSEEIYVGSIVLSSSQDLYNQTWKVEIGESFKPVFRVAENTEPDDEFRKEIYASFDPPVLLKSNIVYMILVTCNKQHYSLCSFSANYDELTITGSMSCRSINTEIEFWFLEDKLTKTLPQRQHATLAS